MTKDDKNQIEPRAISDVEQIRSEPVISRQPDSLNSEHDSAPSIQQTDARSLNISVTTNNNDQQSRGMADDAHTMMIFQNKKKSTGVSYLLWFLLGALGAHRFYLGYTGTGVIYLVLFVVGFITLGFGFIVTGIWLIVDLFLIPGLAERKNSELIASLRSGRVM